MKNIEERASTKYQPIKFTDGTCDPDVVLHNIRMEERRVAYIQGATEQKTIDIYKACAWLRRQLYTGDTGWLSSERYQELGEFLMAFRKAMEE